MTVVSALIGDRRVSLHPPGIVRLRDDTCHVFDALEQLADAGWQLTGYDVLPAGVLATFHREDHRPARNVRTAGHDRD